MIRDDVRQLYEEAHHLVDQPDAVQHYAPLLPETRDRLGAISVGWLEMFQEARVAQQLLDMAGVADGYPQGAGDLDVRVAALMVWLRKIKKSAAVMFEARGRRCGVCMGASPSWDGHDKNPPCFEGAMEMLNEVLEEHP